MKRIDLHVHSENSSDARGSLMDIAIAARDAGLHGFAITDHDACPNMDELQAAADATGLLIVPGCESSTIEGHVLCIGITEAPEKGLDVQSVVEHVQKQGGACVAAHPLKVFSGMGPRGLRHHIESGRIVAAEAINGRDRRLVQDNTLQLLQGMDVPTTGGTDAHWIRDVGTAWTWFPADVTSAADVVAALKAGDVKADGGHLRRRQVWGHRVVFPMRKMGRKLRRSKP